ncbi:unknown [Prevotella sp. CAG:873]|nr:unknown [Prevotella sp. CAG:873]
MRPIDYGGSDDAKDGGTCPGQHSMHWCAGCGYFESQCSADASGKVDAPCQSGQTYAIKYRGERSQP